jgi:hypothetical protein
MELSQFIKQSVQHFDNPSLFVFVFKGSVYPHIFFSHLFDLLAEKLSYEQKFLDLQESSWKAQLSTSFLGMSCIYWLSDLTVLKPKQKEELLLFLQEYQGPHKIILFGDAKTEVSCKKNGMMIVCPDKIFYDDAKHFLSAKDLSQASQQAVFLQKIYKVKTYFSLDELYSVQEYASLVPEDASEFYDRWMSRLVVPETSLFQLSQLLFEKNEEKFFALWLLMKDLYTPMFWVSFWSDQMYKAYFYIEFFSNNNSARTKAMSFGLPFSFIKYGYKNYKLDEIQKFHQALFKVDTVLKQGSNEYILDAVLAQFFSTVINR